MTEDSASTTWKDKIASLTPPAARAEQSPARLRVHANFDEIAAAKDRGVTWQQLTDLFTAEGIAGASGEPLTADALRSLFHTERYARGQRRKRRTKKPTAQPLIQAQAPQPAVTPEPNDDARPRGAFRAIPSKPRQ